MEKRLIRRASKGFARRSEEKTFGEVDRGERAATEQRTEKGMGRRKKRIGIRRKEKTGADRGGRGKISQIPFGKSREGDRK